jgi:hypothetical protein
VAAPDADVDGVAVPVSVGVGVVVGVVVTVGVVVGVGVPLVVGVGVVTVVDVGVGVADVADTGWLVLDAPVVRQAEGWAPGRADSTAPSGSVEPDPAVAVAVAVGWHRVVVTGPRDEPFWDPLAPALAVLCAPVDSVPPPPLPVGEPLPSVPAPPDGWLPVRLLLTWTIAWRSGGTASVIVAMNATPASTATGRSHVVPGAPLARGEDRKDGKDRKDGRDSERSRGGDQAQCPRHTQDRARVTAPDTMLTSHGCGGRLPVLARMRSSPSALGSTASTAADSCRRSTSPRSPFGTVMPSPACPAGTTCPPSIRLLAES